MDVKTVNVLVIGPTQNGKSTFINRLASMAEKVSVLVVKSESEDTEVLAMEGDGHSSCTVHGKVFEMMLPLSDYELLDRETGKYHEVPDARQESKFLAGNWYRRQKSSRYKVRLCDPHAPRVRLRVIDTPGLDDSKGRDYENLVEVLTTLNAMAQSPDSSLHRIHAVTFVYKYDAAYTGSFQEHLRQYGRCMPNLFGGLTVINTSFRISNWAQERQKLRRIGIVQENGSTMDAILKERREKFADILDDKNPVHFLLDSKPHPDLAFDEMVSRNTMVDIVQLWMNSTAMRIGHMRLSTSQKMIAVDNQMQRLLQQARRDWEKVIERHRSRLSRDQALSSQLGQQIDEDANEEGRIRGELELVDNDEPFELQKYTTADDSSTPKRWLKWAFRMKTRDAFQITQPNHEQWTVKAEDGVRARWTQQEREGGTWIGCFEAQPGYLARLTATVYTVNRVQHRKQIASLQSQLARVRKRLADTRNSRASLDHSSGDEELDEVVEWSSAAADLIEILKSENPPLNDSLGPAARTRYRKGVEAISKEDLFDLVRLARPTLEQPLRRVLA